MNTATATAAPALSASRIPAPQFNIPQRFLESRIETSIPGIYLTVVTSHNHSNHSYWSRIDRVQISEGILSMKIDRARFSDIAPVSPRKVAAARYSAKALEAAHAAFLPTVEAQLPEALTWAERF